LRDGLLYFWGREVDQNGLGGKACAFDQAVEMITAAVRFGRYCDVAFSRPARDLRGPWASDPPAP
jgi:hypothetical protein